MDDFITLAHGSGGKKTHDLIRELFLRHFSNEILLKSDDSAVLDAGSGKLAFTTDSFVISPIFFNGGNIGKLSVCGTVNDLSSSGARPLYLSCGLIIEEGFSLSDLEKIIISMSNTANECGVKIVTGDTKVVQKGACDKLFINTSGIGIIQDGINTSGSNAKAGDKIIITGTVGDHGASILIQRENFNIFSDLKSDCAPVNKLTEALFKDGKEIHVLRDPTRGGLATTLNEIAAQSGTGIRLFEDKIPVKKEVAGICEMLGMDPLYMANEGKMIVIVPEREVSSVLSILKKEKYGADSCVIGEIVEGPKKRVFMETLSGGSRIIDMLVGDQLPRIC